VTVLNTFSKKSFLIATNVENKFLSLYETLKSAGEIKLMVLPVFAQFI